MKKDQLQILHVLPAVFGKGCWYVLMFALSPLGVFGQNNGDYRTGVPTANVAAAGYEVYNDGVWTVAATGPDANSTILIRDGHAINNTGTTLNCASLIVGEGNPAIITSNIEGGSISGFNIIEPGKLNAIPALFIINGGHSALNKGTQAAASISSVNVTGFDVRNPGSGYTTASISFSDAPAGGITATGTAIINGGKVIGITITNPGAGYTSLPVITITGNGTNADITAKVGVTSINLTNAGTGYTQAPLVTAGNFIKPGSGSSARTIRTKNDVIFRKGAAITMSPERHGLLAIGGDLKIETPLTTSLIYADGRRADLIVSFEKAGDCMLYGPGSLMAKNVNLTNTATSLKLNADAVLSLSETIVPTGEATVDASAGTLIFSQFEPGSQNLQSFPANVFVNNSVNKVILDNPGGLSLNQSFNIGNLDLQRGVLKVPAASTLTISSVTGANSSSYIETLSDQAGLTGKVKISGIASSFMVPLGNAGAYLPLTLNPATTSGFELYVFKGATENGAVNGPVTADKSRVVDAIFNISRLTGAGNVEVTLGFSPELKGSGFAGLPNNTQFGVSRFNGTAWENITGTGDNTLNTATATFSDLGPFRVAIDPFTVLPVRFGKVTASVQNRQTVNVSWESFSETNLEKYIVERAGDLKAFETVGVVSAANQSSYNFTDSRPAPGNNYYRITAVDKGTTATYVSDIAMANLSLDLAKSIVVYPNPVKEGRMNIKFSNLNKGELKVSVYGLDGKRVSSSVINYNGGVQTEQITLPSYMKSGYYSLQVNDGISAKSQSVLIAE